MASVRFDDGYSTDSEEIFNYANTDDPVINIDLKMSSFRYCGSSEVYWMSENRRGRCLIINNSRFRSIPDREGSDFDVLNLTTAFRALRFHVSLEKDVKSYEFEPLIKKELAHPDHNILGMFVLILMTHGGSGNKIYGTDEKCVDLHSILRHIYNSEALKLKPKFILIQACAGDDNPRRNCDAGPPLSNFQSDAIPSAECTGTAQPHDVLILRSAFDGFVSRRDKQFGSPCVRALVEALYKHSHHWHLEKICKHVQKKVIIFNKRGTAKASLPSYTPFLQKKLFFFPCIPFGTYLTSSTMVHNAGLPAGWDMKAGEVSVVTLGRFTKEYATVAANFTRSMGSRDVVISSIMRVQNLPLYKQYLERRRLIAGKLGMSEKDVERAPLWYGSTQENIYRIAETYFDVEKFKEEIIHIHKDGKSRYDAFRRSGCYFLVDGLYSGMFDFDLQIFNHHHFIIQARAIIGESSRLHLEYDNMGEWPLKPDGTSYDSVQMDDDDQTIVAVCHNHSAYPEYIIQFSWYHILGI